MGLLDPGKKNIVERNELNCGYYVKAFYTASTM